MPVKIRIIGGFRVRFFAQILLVVGYKSKQKLRLLAKVADEEASRQGVVKEHLNCTLLVF